MEGKTTDDKLLPQDDIDTLLGEAGLEGGYDSENEVEASPKRPANDSIVKYSNITDDDVYQTMSVLLAKALLERDNDVKVIWNAGGTLPMTTGFNMNIQDMEFESLGVIKEHHLLVKQKSIK